MFCVVLAHGSLFLYRDIQETLLKQNRVQGNCEII